MEAEILQACITNRANKGGLDLADHRSFSSQSRDRNGLSGKGATGDRPSA